MTNEQITQLKKKLDSISTEFHISRFPKSSKTFVVDYANQVFEGDYGMCLHHIVNTFRGMMPVGFNDIQEQIDELRTQINEQQMSKEEPVKGIKMADGTMKR